MGCNPGRVRQSSSDNSLPLCRLHVGVVGVALLLAAALFAALFRGYALLLRCAVSRLRSRYAALFRGCARAVAAHLLLYQLTRLASSAALRLQSPFAVAIWRLACECSLSRDAVIAAGIAAFLCKADFTIHFYTILRFHLRGVCFNWASPRRICGVSNHWSRSP